MTGGLSAGESMPNAHCAHNRDRIAQTTFGGGLSHVWPYFLKRWKQQSALGHTEGPPSQLTSSKEAAECLYSHENSGLLKVWDNKTSFILFWLLHAIPWAILYFIETDCTQTHFGIKKKFFFIYSLIRCDLGLHVLHTANMLSVQESNGRQKLRGIWSLQAD